jgi:hypothetical protein
MVWSPDYLGSPGKVVLSNPLTCTNTPKGENKLYSDAKGVVPSLDLRFAEGKNLNDYMTGTPLVDHQRSMSGSNLSAGTFVNSNGLIETAKVNALTANSEVFSSWAVPSTSTATTTSPFNTTAVSIDSASALSISVNDSSAVTFSGYFKQGSSRYVYLRPVVWADNPRVWFDLQTGNFVNVSPAAAPISNAFATSVGNGWYRCGFTLDSTGDSVGNLQITATDSSTNINSVGYVFAFGIQVEEGPVSTYIPTTNLPSAAPRFDHDPTTGESLGLLIEESRTNNLKTSNDFSGWLLSNITNNVSTQLSPDGSFNAAEFETTGNSATYPYNGKPGTQLPAGTYTFSVWTKFEISFSVLIYGSNLGALLLFDAATKQPSTATIQQGASSFVGTVEEYPNGWYRLSATIIVNSGSLVTEATVALNKNKVTTYGLPDASGVGDVLTIWGAQLEEGSFPTSYIPTTGTALTRSADVASITGSNFSGFYNQGPGSWFAIARGGRSSGSNSSRVVGVAGARALIGTKASDSNGWNAFDGTNNPTIANGQEHYDAFGKIAVGYDENTLSIVSNPAITSSVPSLHGSTTYSSITIGGRTDNTNEQLNGIIARLTYFPERLPDSSLQTMTTP